MCFISWSSKLLMFTGDELPWGHALFERKNKKGFHILPQLVSWTNRKKEKKSMRKSPVYKLVPGATWICVIATLKGLALLFTLMYSKEREWWQASITWYTWYATAQNQQRLAFRIPFFFYSVMHKYDCFISLGLDFKSLKHLCFCESTPYLNNFHSMYYSS